MSITLDQLRVLVTVNNSGSFSKAAELLGQTPSAVSRKISQLEKQLGLQLFTRTTRQISLTDEGKIVTEKSQQALSVVNDIQDNANWQHSTPKGKLKIDAPAPFLEHCILPYLPDFMAKYPEVEIELASFDKQVDLIEKQIDIAFRIGPLKDSSLHFRPVGRSLLRILASPSYIKKEGEPETVTDLNNHSLVGFSQPITLNSWPLKFNKDHKAFEFKSQLICDSGSAVRQAAIEGIGIVCLADFMTKNDIESGRLVQVLNKETTERFQSINAVFYKPYQSSLKLMCFINFIIEALGDKLEH